MKEAGRQKFSLVIFKELFKATFRATGLIWFNKKLVFFVLFFLVLFAAAPFFISGSRGFLLNELAKVFGSNVFGSGILVALLVFIAASIFFPLVSILNRYFSELMGIELDEQVEIALLRKKGELEIAVREDPKQNDLFNRVREQGVWRLQNFVNRQFFILQNILEAVIAAVILFIADWWLLPLILISIIPELFAEAKYGSDTWRIWVEYGERRRKFWNFSSHFDEVPKLVELKLFQNVKYFFELIKEIFLSFQMEHKKASQRHLFYQLFGFIFSQGAAVGAIVWLVAQVVNGALHIGTFTFFLASIGDFRQALSSLFTNLGRQYQDGLFVKDVFAFLDLKPVLLKAEKEIVLFPDRTPSIVFDNVSFSYPGTNINVLNHFSLTISPGEKVALVGANGAGKTTFVKLLLRFYDPTEGRILIDGHNLKDLNLESWYRQVGVIFQDYANYHFLVKEAIAIGQTGKRFSLEKVKEAAQAAEADVFIEEWEKKYEQMLGKQFSGGVEPSVGQWQKLALARTFYRDPNILILDEPTSAVDAEAEAKIFEKLEKLSKDRTVILISHRFSTVRQANRIGVIKNGEVIELGSHEELVKKDGLYARLFKLQARGYQ